MASTSFAPLSSESSSTPNGMLPGSTATSSTANTNTNTEATPSSPTTSFAPTIAGHGFPVTGDAMRQESHQHCERICQDLHHAFLSGAWNDCILNVRFVCLLDSRPPSVAPHAASGGNETAGSAGEGGGGGVADGTSNGRQGQQGGGIMTRSYRLHRVILARSPLLEAMMKTNPNPELELVIEDPNVDEHSLAIALSHLYSPSFHLLIDLPNPRSMLAAAHLLRLDSLIYHATELCRNSIASVKTPEGVKEWFEFLQPQQQQQQQQQRPLFHHHLPPPSPFYGAHPLHHPLPHHAPPPPLSPFHSSSTFPPSPHPGTPTPGFSNGLINPVPSPVPTMIPQLPPQPPPPSQSPQPPPSSSDSLAAEAPYRQLYGQSAVILKEELSRHVQHTLPLLLNAFGTRPQEEQQQSTTTTTTNGDSSDPTTKVNNNTNNNNDSSNGISPAKMERDQNGWLKLVKIFARLPFVEFKESVESGLLPARSDKERFEFAKKCISDRKKLSPGLEFDESVVLAFGGGSSASTSTSNVQVIRKPRNRRALWKVGG